MEPQPVDSLLFKRPNFHGDFDMEVFHARCPEDATCKGMFFDDILTLAGKLSEEQRTRIEQVRPRYLSFKDYPLREHMRLSWQVVSLLYPGVPKRRAYRELGWRAYPIVESSMIGKVLFGILGNDLDAIFRVGPKGFSMSLSHSQMMTEKLGDRHWRCTMRDVFGVLDPYYIGVVEGPILHHGFTPDVRIHSTSLSDATLDIQWS
jgi:uncharacterized protein (TIGR02265 family)